MIATTFTAITSILIRYVFILKGELNMRNICKKLLTIVTCLSLAMCLSVPVFASEVPENAENSINEGIATCSNHYESGGIVVGSTWKTVASSTTGFNCNVKVSSLGTTLGKVDVRLLGKKGNVLWSQYESFGTLGYGIYWCGSDVYKIQVKYHSSNGRGTISTFPAN